MNQVRELIGIYGKKMDFAKWKYRSKDDFGGVAMSSSPNRLPRFPGLGKVHPKILFSGSPKPPMN
jgi:hypothetical protein